MFKEYPQLSTIGDGSEPHADFVYQPFSEQYTELLYGIGPVEDASEAPHSAPLQMNLFDSTEYTAHTPPSAKTNTDQEHLDTGTGEQMVQLSLLPSEERSQLQPNPDSEISLMQQVAAYRTMYSEQIDHFLNEQKIPLDKYEEARKHDIATVLVMQKHMRAWGVDSSSIPQTLAMSQLMEATRDPQEFEKPPMPTTKDSDPLDEAVMRYAMLAMSGKMEQMLANASTRQKRLDADKARYPHPADEKVYASLGQGMTATVAEIQKLVGNDQTAVQSIMSYISGQRDDLEGVSRGTADAIAPLKKLVQEAQIIPKSLAIKDAGNRGEMLAAAMLNLEPGSRILTVAELEDVTHGQLRTKKGAPLDAAMLDGRWGTDIVVQREVTDEKGQSTTQLELIQVKASSDVQQPVLDDAEAWLTQYDADTASPGDKRIYASLMKTMDLKARLEGMGISTRATLYQVNSHSLHEEITLSPDQLAQEAHVAHAHNRRGHQRHRNHRKRTIPERHMYPSTTREGVSRVNGAERSQQESSAVISGTIFKSEKTNSHIHSKKHSYGRDKRGRRNRKQSQYAVTHHHHPQPAMMS